MANPIETRKNPNLLTGGPQQLTSEGFERAAEDVVSSFSQLSPSERQIFAEKQPKLLPRKSEVKYSRFTGIVLIPRYAPISATRRKQIEQEKHGQQDLDLKVSGKRPSEPIWIDYQTVEHAIGSRVHILERYQPTDETQEQNTEIQKFESIIDFTHRLMDLFETGEITEDNLTNYYDQAYSLIEDHGLLRTWVPNRKKAIEQVLKAIDVDSIGRLNPTISRMRLASASIKWMIELYVGDMTIDKNQRLLLALIQEREIERFYVEQVVEATQRFLSLDTNDTSVSGEKQNLYEVALELFRHNTVKTAPYRIPAFRFLFGSFGVPDIRSSGFKYLFANMFGPESKDPILDVEQIEADFQSEEQTAQARFRTRLRNGVNGMIDALKQGDEKFDEYEKIIPALVTNGKK
jgi:hypothetical protein